MGLRFTKMHGLGNDFVVIDATASRFEPTAELLERLTDRRRGVGCDQVLVVEAASGADRDFDYRIFNANGSEVGQCGNGARCLARFIQERGLSSKPRLRLQTRTTALEVEQLGDGQVRANIGVPRFEPAQVPFQAEARADRYMLTLPDGTPIEIGVVGLGNPHAVIETGDIEHAPVENLGAALQKHPAFPEQVNVGFLQIRDPAYAELRVYERGVGETPACGSGACAAAVIGRVWGRLGPRTTIVVPGGELIIEWEGAGHPVFMTGPAIKVFEGELEWEKARPN